VVNPIVAVGFAPVGTDGICEAKAIVPPVAGNVQVVFAVKSAEVIVPVKDVVPLATAEMIIGS